MFSWLVTLGLPEASNNKSSFKWLKLYTIPPLVPRLVRLPLLEHKQDYLQHLARHSNDGLPISPTTLNPLIEAPHSPVVPHRTR